ncbi:MAG: signal peptidase II [Myxococcales bacterium]|nr:signal peptidase II [Myxococcales bacterium]
MSRLHTLLFSGALLLALGCDQATKRVAEARLAPFEPVSLWSDLVRFELVPNVGGFLSLGQNLPESARTALFAILVPLSLALICFWLLRDGQASNRMVLGLGLVAGGGVGNWLDRLAQGAVVDFVSVGVGPLRTGIFNLADVLIFLGIGFLLLDLRSPPAEPRAPEEPGAT